MTSTTTTRDTQTKARHLADLKQEIADHHVAACAKQAVRGTRGARERMLALLDEGSFVGGARVPRITPRQ